VEIINARGERIKPSRKANREQNEFGSTSKGSSRLHTKKVDGRGNDGGGGGGDDDEDDEQERLLDPTYSDADRVSADSGVQHHIQHHPYPGAAVRRTRQQASMRGQGYGAGWTAGENGEAVVEYDYEDKDDDARDGSQSTVLPPCCYVPCRIRFTLLAKLSPKMSWANVTQHKPPSYLTPSAARGGSTPMTPLKTPTTGSGAYSKLRPQETFSHILGHQSTPLGIGSDHAVARLLASTLWVSAEAARSVWGCARDGEAQALLHEATQRHAAFHRCMAVGHVASAYSHAHCCALLSQNYQLAVSVNRAYNSAAVKFKRLVASLVVCRDMLTSSNVSFDTNALGMTIARHICLGFRYVLMSPQIAHFRGGCAYLLKGVKRIEKLLNLTPIRLERNGDPHYWLPDRLLSPPASNNSKTGAAASQAQNDPSASSIGPAAGAMLSGAADGGKGGPAALPMSRTIRPDDVAFESAFSKSAAQAFLSSQFAPNRAAGATATAGGGSGAESKNPSPAAAAAAAPTGGTFSEAKRTVPFNPDSTQNPTSNNRLINPSTSGVHSATHRGKHGTANEGEIAFRRSLAQPEVTQEVAAILHELHGMSQCLLLVLSEDLLATCPDIRAAMSCKSDQALAAETVPRAALGLGVPVQGSGGIGSGLSAGADAGTLALKGLRPPQMVPAGECLEYVLGQECKCEKKRNVFFLYVICC
jgi:hypothetical protein